MIWEDDDRPDHETHLGAGILVALPLAAMLWTALFWGGNRIYDWMQAAPCGEVRR